MNIKQILRGVFCLIMFVGSSNLIIYSPADASVNVKYAEEVLTPGGPDEDIPGYSSESIPVAFNAIKYRGGTFKLSPGVFHIMALVLNISDNLISLSKNVVYENDKRLEIETRHLSDILFNIVKL